MRRALSILLATVLATIGVMAFAPTPAQAVSCPSSYVCLHDPQQFGSPIWASPAASVVTAGCVNLTSFNNRVTSWQNPSGYRFVAFNSYNCSDLFGMYTIFPRSSNPNVGPDWNDKTSSILFVGS